MNDERLLNRRKKALSKIPKLEESIRGTVVIMNRVCGKPNCRCRKGYKHKGVYLSQTHKGKTRMIYIPQASAKKAKEYIKNYKKTKAVLNIVSDINIKLLKRQ